VPVVILGGQTFAVRAVAGALADKSPEVRIVLTRQGDARELGPVEAKVAVGPTNDPDFLDAVLAGAHTVCMLDPSREWWPDQNADIVRSPEIILDRARAARIARVLAVENAIRLDPGSPPERARAERRLLIQESGIPFGIIRTNIVYGRDSELLLMITGMARTRPRARVIGTGDQRWAPVLVDDLAAVLAAADDREAFESGVWGLDGPDLVTMNELVDLLAGKHRVARTTVARPGRSGSIRERRWALSDETLGSLSRDVVAGPPSAAEEFGVELTPLRQGLMRSLD